MDGEWTCWDCGEAKHVTLFPLHKKGRHGRHELCKACHNRRAKAYRAKHGSSKEVELRVRLKTLYNMTPEVYTLMLIRQGGGCAICHRTPEEEGRRLAVDHDHDCCPGRTSCGGCVRGILCGECNSGIGKFDHDPEKIIAAGVYMETWITRREA